MGGLKRFQALGLIKECAHRQGATVLLVPICASGMTRRQWFNYGKTVILRHA